MTNIGPYMEHTHVCVYIYIYTIIMIITIILIIIIIIIIIIVIIIYYVPTSQVIQTSCGHIWLVKSIWNHADIHSPTRSPLAAKHLARHELSANWRTWPRHRCFIWVVVDRCWHWYLKTLHGLLKIIHYVAILPLYCHYFDILPSSKLT